ncbi:hypothetical protein CDAR_96341 [Caerostris darwini]|uniref:Uncharacterized protein n=1 Tax=Caerostris darwini TaxID=1538125 RepID=A0AAV4TB55_9ARAC|nr:hypothetical protein CDAR_96341 [Caerostris darwini]
MPTLFEFSKNSDIKLEISGDFIECRALSSSEIKLKLKMSSDDDKSEKRGRVFVWGALSAHCACSVDGGGDDDKGREREPADIIDLAAENPESLEKLAVYQSTLLVYSYCGGKTYYRGARGSKMSEDNSSLRAPFNEGAHT